VPAAQRVRLSFPSRVRYGAHRVIELRQSSPEFASGTYLAD
jgi:hypothetical protein